MPLDRPLGLWPIMAAVDSWAEERGRRHASHVERIAVKPPVGVVLSVLVVQLLTGCRAGFSRIHEGAAVDPKLQGSNGLIDRATPGTALRQALSHSDAGNVVQRVIDQHGGWDRWRRLQSVEYVVHRRESVESGVDDTVADPDDAAQSVVKKDLEPARVVFDASRWDDYREEEKWLFSLPFLLAQPRYGVKYLGVELDLAESAAFDKLEVKGSLPGRSDTDYLVVYVNRATGIVTRVLSQRADGAWTLTVLSGWRTTAGFRVPTRRQVFALPGRFHRVRDQYLARHEEIEQLQLDVESS